MPPPEPENRRARTGVRADGTPRRAPTPRDSSRRAREQPERGQSGGRGEGRRGESRQGGQAAGGRDGARAGAAGASRRRDDDRAGDPRAPRSWGSLARKGTRQLHEEGVGPASVAWREAVERSRVDAGSPGEEPWQPEVWVPDPSADTRPPAAGGRRSARSRTSGAAPSPEPRVRKPRTLPPEVASEVADAVGGAKLAGRIQQRLTDASGAYERERYADALRMLKPLAEQAPGAAAVRELHGLTLYRLGRWDAASKELEAFRALSSSIDQLPTLADCYRAKKKWSRVDGLWEELRQASPAPELLAEGRLVMAGSLAERGRLADAIELLQRAKVDHRRPKLHQLRTLYALADLYERAGEVPRARELFRRILDADPELYDVGERLASIGG